jgi:hypothetical protein
MTTRTFTNFWLDVVSLVAMLGLAATGGLIHFVLPAGSGHFYELFGWNRHDFGRLHFYFAVASVVLLALHLLLHWNWICCVVAKTAGKGAPSRRSQTLFGLGLLLAVSLLLAGGLWWASGLVQATTPEGGGRGRRAHLDIAYRIEDAAPAAQPAAQSTEEPEATPAKPLPPAVARLEAPPSSSGDGRHGQHEKECPAGEAIDGRTSLAEAARICGLTVGELIDRLKLPARTAPGERLGRLKRLHGLNLHEVRDLACRANPRE